MTDQAPQRQIDVFISHSSQDSDVVERLVDLLRIALTVRADQIRCTSVDGYRLPAGAETNEQLREEALSARVFVGVLSPFSLASAYVLFELGARWGAKKPILPLLVGGMGPQALRGPLSTLNVLSASSASQLHQLVGEIADALGVTAAAPSTYQHQVDAIVSLDETGEPAGAFRSGVVHERLAPEYEAPEYVGPPSTIAFEEYEGAELVVMLHCENEWPDDFHMRKHCVDQQYAALAELRKGRPQDIPADAFGTIREKCKKEWPNDYRMRHHCEQQQVAGYRQLQRK